MVSTGGGSEDGGRGRGPSSGLPAAAASCLDCRESDSWIGLAGNWLPRLVQMVLFTFLVPGGRALHDAPPSGILEAFLVVQLSGTLKLLVNTFYTTTIL